MTRLNATAVDEMASLVASKLDDLIRGVVGLSADVNALEVDTEGLQASLAVLIVDVEATNMKLDAIVTKLAGGLPSGLQSGRLKVTGLL